jgi:hypothetical protein
MIKSLNIPKGKLLVIVLSVLQVMASDYPFDIFKLLIIVLSVLQVMASDYPFGIFKLLIIVLFVLLQVMASDYPRRSGNTMIKIFNYPKG